MIESILIAALVIGCLMWVFNECKYGLCTDVYEVRKPHTDISRTYHWR